MSTNRAESPTQVFLRGVLKAYGTVGALAPTSAGVARRMAELGGVPHAHHVAELGAGTGAVTRTLLRALPADGTLDAYELYAPFADHLRASVHDPRLRVLTASAETLGGGPNARPFDAVISALPFSFLGHTMTDTVLRAVAAALTPNGTFVALQYHPWFLRPHLKRHFASVQVTFHPWNLPPALLLVGKSPR